MSPTNFFADLCVSNHDPRTHDVRKRRPQGFEGILYYVKYMHGLAGWRLSADSWVGRQYLLRCCARDADYITCSNGAAVALDGMLAMVHIK